jgi:hypothetical protein
MVVVGNGCNAPGFKHQTTPAETAVHRQRWTCTPLMAGIEWKMESICFIWQW